MNTTATVTATNSDPDTTKNSSSVVLGIREIPTMSTIGIVLLVVLMGIVGTLAIRRL